jgi:hypothetical protein
MLAMGGSVSTLVVIESKTLLENEKRAESGGTEGELWSAQHYRS